MIRYTLLKAVQVLAFITLPIIFYNHIMVGEYIWALFDLFVIAMYISDVRNRTLEMELHNELY
tara:strand:+ start:2896 stop:3084 length:189 start_codon:yes stop_codon:yes gene_type:complete